MRGNQAWLAQHGRLAQAWLHGVELTPEIEGSGRVTLRIERNPLEALRLGTFVGSCLGLGGKFVYSAAATVLDINKQVVFARAEDGRLLARQVVAITDAGELACFDVYPRSSRDLQQAFIDYDRAFEAALGTSVLTEIDERGRGKVSCILAQDWWDDGVWDLTIEED